MTCHVASSAVKVGQRVRALRDACREVALQTLRVIDDEGKMATVLDPEGNQAAPKAGPVQKKMLDGRAPAQWLRAYWKGRELGWWT